jgi:hypothetical protein
MLAAILVIGIVAAMVLPATGSSLAAYRFRGDGQAIANLLALAKMRAAAQSTHARLFVNRADNTYSMQVWTRPAGPWVTDGGGVQLSRGVTFAAGVITTPPPTQATMALAPACKGDDMMDVANTTCIVFNSRGVPINSASVPTGGNALYLTDGTGVYAVTVTATPLIRLWWTANRSSGASWVEQQ